MKKIFPFLLLIFGSAQAQISLENVYPANVFSRLGVIHLTTSGYKYMEADTDHIVIYNLNHTVFKNIPIPVNNIDPTVFNVQFVSEELFDTSATDVEYALTYRDSSHSAYHFRVFDENANLLFTKDSMILGGSSTNDGYAQMSIAYTPNGVKMMLLHTATGVTNVYSLPGILPCSQCSEGGEISGIAPSPNANGNSQTALPLPYPNPTNTVTTIPYQLPPGTTTGEIIFYDLTGREIKRVNVTRSFTTIEITTADLAAGTYYYTLQTTKGIIPGNKIIINK